MSGIRLLELNATELLDALHHIFEVDNAYSSEEEMKSKLKMREVLYESLYGQAFKYKYVDKSKNAGSFNNTYTSASGTSNLEDLPLMPDEEAVKPFNPRAEKPKAYIPPTTFDGTAAKPFGDILDAPMG